MIVPETPEYEVPVNGKTVAGDLIQISTYRFFNYYAFFSGKNLRFIIGFL